MKNTTLFFFFSFFMFFFQTVSIFGFSYQSPITKLVPIFRNHQLLKTQPFEEIVLTGNVSVLLKAGETESIDIKNDEDRLEIEFTGKTLSLKAKDLLKYNKTPTIKVIVTYKKLWSIKARAGASVFAEESISGEKLELSFSSGASGELELNQQSLDISVTEGGNLKLSGETDFQEVKVATGGSLFAYQLDCKETVARANTGGNAKVFASETIDASANTGGSILYKGNPSKVRTKDNLSGTVKAS